MKKWAKGGRRGGGLLTGVLLLALLLGVGL